MTKWKRSLRCSSLLLLLAPSRAFALDSKSLGLPTIIRSASILLASAKENNPPEQQVVSTAEKKEYKNEASSLFGNLRIPASLFAGASAGAAFALPVGHAPDGLKVGLVKRLYALLMMGALSSEIVTVVVSTLAVGSIATRSSCPPTTSVNELLKQEYALEWVSARLHFLSGVIMFILGVGIRAWISIDCPVISKAALGIVLSSATLCLAFIQELEQASAFVDGLLVLPFRYFTLMFRAAKRRPLFALAFLLSLATNIYVAVKVPHIAHYLTRK